jgi:hypothetical protein
MNHSFYTDNAHYNKDKLTVVEEALIKSQTIKSLDELTSNGQRLHIDSDDESSFYVHIGGQDPYQGGSGYNYSIDKKSLEVIFLSSEIYAPTPTFE